MDSATLELDMLDRGNVEKAYAGWAPFYDLVFGAIFTAGRTAAVGAAERVGGRILEVGVGTGISLGEYSGRHRVVGVDLSEPMLRRAKARVKKHKLAHAANLMVMDAQQLGFADGYFDVVVAQYVITAVPDPEAALNEFARVVKPDGEIVLVNHLCAENGLRRACETGLAPVVRHLGWRLEFPFARLSAWAKGAGFHLVERQAVQPLGYFSLLRFKKSAN